MAIIKRNNKMSKFDEAYKQYNEAGLNSKTAFNLNKAIDNKNRELAKLKKDYQKLIASTSSDRDLYVAHNNVINQSFDQVERVLADFQEDIKNRM